MKKILSFQLFTILFLSILLTSISSCKQSEAADLIIQTPAEKVKEELIKVINSSNLSLATIYESSDLIDFADTFTFHGTFVEVEGIYYNLHNLTSYSLYEDRDDFPYDRTIILRFN